MKKALTLVFCVAASRKCGMDLAGVGVVPCCTFQVFHEMIWMIVVTVYQLAITQLNELLTMFFFVDQSV